MLIGLLVPILVYQTFLRSLQYCLVFSYSIEMSDWAKSGWKYYETRAAEDLLFTLLLANPVCCMLTGKRIQSAVFQIQNGDFFAIIDY